VKIFFFVGRNDDNLSRVSSKLWKIERRGRRITVFWGPAMFDRRTRKHVPVGVLQKKTHPSFSSEMVARDFEIAIIARKENAGYQRTPRRQSRCPVR
jgi:hypothetical protein